MFETIGMILFWWVFGWVFGGVGVFFFASSILRSMESDAPEWVEWTLLFASGPAVWASMGFAVYGILQNNKRGDDDV